MKSGLVSNSGPTLRGLNQAVCMKLDARYSSQHTCATLVRIMSRRMYNYMLESIWIILLLLEGSISQLIGAVHPNYIN
jgi:hypothetical protein